MPCEFHQWEMPSSLQYIDTTPKIVLLCTMFEVFFLFALNRHKELDDVRLFVLEFCRTPPTDELGLA